MKRITFFIGSLSSGGAEHQLSELANMLSKEGNNVTIVTFSDEQDHYSIDSCIKRERLAPNRNKTIKLLAIFSYFLRVKTDCIISFTQRANLLALIPMQFRSRRIKFIAGERNFSANGSDKIEELLFGYLYKRADWIVPNSFSQANYIKKRKPVYSEKVKPITNFTNIDIYKPMQYEFNGNRFAVFCRYDPQKNYERFAYAIKIIKDEIGEGFHIDWFGNVEFKGSINPYYEHFNDLLERYSLHKVLTLNTHVKNVSERMQQYDAIILPSLYEGFSNAIGEAICCARPMIVSDVSDNSVMVQNGINGFLFNPCIEEDIADKIKQFILLPFDKRKEMSLNSRAIAESLFDKSNFLNSYLSLI